jgi:hypothetical protein
LVKVLGCVALSTALWSWVLAVALPALVWLPIAVKMAITVALIAPLGFLMGIPFPTGLERLEEWHAPSVRWAWSLNAAASVMGSVGALVCCIYMGLVQTLILGGLLYVAALAVFGRVRGTSSGRPEAGSERVVLAS